jgi:hypothetical protein
MAGARNYLFCCVLALRPISALSNPEDDTVPQNLERHPGSNRIAIIVELEIRLGLQSDRKVE